MSRWEEDDNVEHYRETRIGQTYKYPLRTVKDALAFVREKPTLDALIAALKERDERLTNHPEDFIDNGTSGDRIHAIITAAFDPFDGR